ncbi:MAG TPA: polysaccharide biosynthesis tyrosine autokinase [Gemmatimonadales bacterium]|nr:polysaccharide biosynthesis tyrosine autokinase [Gemmatimonadales bacterium]
MSDPLTAAGLAPDASVRTVGLDELLGALRRHVRVVLAAAALGVGAAAAVAYLKGPVYRAVAVIRLSDPRRTLTGGVVDDPARVDERFSDPLLSQVELLTSRTVAGAVVDGMPLLRVTARGFPPGLLAEVAVAGGTPADTFRLTFGPHRYLVLGRSRGQSAPYGAAVEFDSVRFAIAGRPDAGEGSVVVLTREAAVSRLLEHLRVKPRIRTDLVDVAYSAPDPVVAQRVVNRVVDIFQQASAEAAQRQSRWRREFLEEQLRVNDSLLAEARQELTEFLNRRERAYGSRESRERDVMGLAGFELQREQLEAERRTYQGLLASLRDSAATRRAVQAALAMPSLAAGPAVTQLSRQLFEQEAARDSLASLSPSHPDLPRLAQLIAGTEASLTRAVQAAVQSAIGSLDGRIAALNDVRGRQQQLAATEGEENRLRERVENARKVVDALQVEYQHAKIAEAVTVGQVEIVDHATLPVAPAGIGLPEQLALGLLVGLLLGGAGAFAADRLGRSIGQRAQVEQLGVPVLGIVPHCNRDALDTDTRSAEAIVEAFRGIRLGLFNGQGPGGGPTRLTVTVTSPASGDGKSFVSANLALAFAYAGYRTLLVDADLRRGALHRSLDLARQPGLTDFLAGTAPPEQIVRATSHARLAFLASGSRRADAPELLGSPRMGELMRRLQETHEVVVLDSPPVGAGVDALTLGALAGSVLIVLRLGRTERALAEAKLDMLRRARLRVLGAVLNDVREDSEYYAYTYYMDGYALANQPLFRPLVAKAGPRVA